MRSTVAGDVEITVRRFGKKGILLKGHGQRGDWAAKQMPFKTQGGEASDVLSRKAIRSEMGRSWGGRKSLFIKWSKP